MVTKLENDSRIPVGARLFRFRKQWRDLVPNHGMVTKGLGWKWVRFPPPHSYFPQRQNKWIGMFIEEMLQKRVIEETNKIRWQSKLFVVPKKEEGKKRIILDLSALNQMIVCPKFKMLTLKEVRRNLPKGVFTCSLDLKDGYWHVPITPKLRPFLGFTYGNQLFQFRGMPFGLNVAPRAFTKIIFQVSKVAAKEGIWLLPYLDDILVVSQSREQNLDDALRTRQIFEELGFLINEEKSRMTPAQKFQWLGVEWNVKSNPSCTVPLTTLEKLANLIDRTCQPETTKRKQIMKLQGLANWIANVDPFFKLLTALTRSILRTFSGSLDKKTPITLPRFTRARVLLWRSYHTVPAPLGTPDPDVHIMTDASRTGWGIVMNKKRYMGSFHPSMVYSINVKELLVVWMALLLVNRRGISIRIMVDNTQAIYAVRKGFAKTYHLRSLAELVRKRLRSLHQTLDIKHIKGSYNVISDQLSRNTTISTEWALPQEFFNRTILRKFPDLEWDLFATSLNHKLNKFIAPCPDLGAAAVDALSLDWARLQQVYMFPPTPLISKVLEKLTATPPKEVVLITREFTARPWFVRLLQISKSHSRISVQLEQIVGNKTVRQELPTSLLVWRL